MKVAVPFIAGVRVLEPDCRRDGRGWFAETYNAARYRAAGIEAEFVQDNESFSMEGLRVL